MAENVHSFHEGKACDAVIRSIEARRGILRETPWSPERDRHTVAIDFACCLGGVLTAFEHTGIEPFDGHIQSNVHSADFFGPVRDAVRGKLPESEEFELHVSPTATATMQTPADRRRVQQALIDWIIETAPTLPIANAGRVALPIRRITPLGVPFWVTFHRSELLVPPGGELQTVHLLEEGFLEPARKARLLEACRRKFGKLAQWKRDQGAQTVLVLEERDIQLTNAVVVTEGVIAACEALKDRPDEIYLVTTSLPRRWLVSSIFADGLWLTECEDHRPRTWKIDPSMLSDLIGRGQPAGCRERI